MGTQESVTETQEMAKKMARLRATRQDSTMTGKVKSGEVRSGEESHIDARRENAEQSDAAAGQKSSRFIAELERESRRLTERWGESELILDTQEAVTERQEMAKKMAKQRKSASRSEAPAGRSNRAAAHSRTAKPQQRSCTTEEQPIRSSR